MGLKNMRNSSTYTPLMNNTKWEELRLGMHNLTPPPKWRTKDLMNGYISNWDGEWFYHFKVGGYETIEWVEILFSSPEQKEMVLTELSKIHIPIEILSESIKVFGFVLPGVFTEYAKL